MSGPYPYYQDEHVTLYCGRCEDIMSELPDSSVDVVMTDPPYGVNKSHWDADFDVAWMWQSARLCRHAIAVMPGIDNLLYMPQKVGTFEYRWCLSVHITNGMTRGRMGFGNWIPLMVYAQPGTSLHRSQQDAAAVAISGHKPSHPSPKPFHAMVWALSRFEARTVLDPFAGSGTTLMAARELGVHATGIEMSEEYCSMIVRRLRGTL